MKKFVPFILSILMSLGLISVRPFDIYASSFDSSNIVGTYAEILSYTSIEPEVQTVSGDKYCNADFLVEVHVILDDSYIGNITGDLRLSYYSYTISNNTATQVVNTYNLNNSTYYVNGTEFTISFNLRTMIRINNNIQNPVLNSNMLFTVDDSEVVVIPENSRAFNIPFESLNFYYQLFYNGNFDSLDYSFDNYNMNLPIYFIPANSIVYQGLANNTSNANFNRSFTFVFATDLQFSNTTTLANVLQLDSTWRLSNMKIISYSTLNIGSYSKTIRIVRFDVKPSTAVAQTIKLKPNADCYFTPIFAGYTYSYYVSTEFAMQFNLTNSMLDDIHEIAYGNTNSDNRSNELETDLNNFESSKDDLFDLEDNFSNNLNDSLDDIDTTFTFENGFGSKFLASSNFIKNEFDFLTTNTAFGSLLSFSLLLGLGLLILGKIL